MDSWISKCFQLHLEWDTISTLPARKWRADNERVVEILGIWSRHMGISVNGEQTDHNPAAFWQRLSNSWKPINTNCFELQLLLNEVREDKVMHWLMSKWCKVFMPWTHTQFHQLHNAHYQLIQKAVFNIHHISAQKEYSTILLCHVVPHKWKVSSSKIFEKYFVLMFISKIMRFLYFCLPIYI